MAKKAYVKIQNLPEILKKINKVGSAVDDVLMEAVKAATEIVESDMQARANKIKRSGTLHREIRIKSLYDNKAEHKAKAYIGPGGKDINYAFHAEVGTRDTKAQPYARPAVDKNKSKIKEIINDKFIQGHVS